MGMFDHRRQWHYVVAAEPRECLHAFANAFAGRHGIANAKWKISTSATSAKAIYEGRAGAMAGIARVLSRDAAQEEDTAIGSEISFRVTKTEDGKSDCVMLLESAGRSGIGGMLGATSDARFIRPYMQAVAGELRLLDPNATVETH